MKLSYTFSELERAFKTEGLTVGKLLDYFKEKGGCLAALLLSFPFLLPIPLPGLSIPFGILIIISGVEFLMGKWIGIPNKILSRSIHSTFFSKVFEKGQKFLLKVEQWIRPRRTFLVFFPGAKLFQATIIIICGLLLSLPLPPGTNAPPASAIFFTCLGILEEDGICCLLGYICFGLNVLFFSALGIFGVEGIEKLWHSQLVLKVFS